LKHCLVAVLVLACTSCGPRAAVQQEDPVTAAATAMDQIGRQAEFIRQVKAFERDGMEIRDASRLDQRMRELAALLKASNSKLMSAPEDQEFLFEIASFSVALSSALKLAQRFPGSAWNDRLTPVLQARRDVLGSNSAWVDRLPDDAKGRAELAGKVGEWRQRWRTEVSPLVDQLAGVGSPEEQSRNHAGR